MSPPKFCPDCVFCKLSYSLTHGELMHVVADPIDNRCMHPETLARDPVALATRGLPRCVDQRAPQGACGLAALYFDPIPPPPPAPPTCREICEACGPIKDGRHRSIICRITIALSKDHPEHEQQKRSGGVWGRRGARC